MRLNMMISTKARGAFLLGGFAASLALSGTRPALGQWPQWGGPNRDFVAKAADLASSWSEGGPKKIWSRSLGDGYSAIAMEGDVLFTMYLKDKKNIIVALKASTGETVWEYEHAGTVPEGIETRFGIGPRSTPTIAKGNVYALSFDGLLTCLNKSTGEVVWSHDLMKEFGAKSPEFGFSSSPIVYKNTLVVAVGGKGCGLIIFDLDSGSVAWKKHDFENLYSSPIVINVGGEDQIVLLTDQEVVGVSAKNGDMRWTVPHVNQWKTNIITPLWGEDGLLYVASSGEAGSRMLKLTRNGAKTEAKEVWASRKMKTGHGNAVRVGDHVYGVGGYQNAATISAINALTGEIAWQEKEKGYSAGTLVYADKKLFLLKDDGSLSLMVPSPKGLEIKSNVQLLKENAWAMPTIAGKRMFVRDTENIMALDLG